MAATHCLRFLFTLVILCMKTTLPCSAAIPIPKELLKGFSAVPEHSSATSFQPLLRDSTGNFTLGFLRVNQNQLALAILHAPSSEPFWVANPIRLASWSETTLLFFNGSLVISDPERDLLWSTGTTGDRVVLLNTSNLQVQQANSVALWQSFHFPTNTLVQDQNFTSNMSLVSQNGLYTLRIGDDFMGLYAKYGESEKSSLEELYWKHTALEAKAEIEQGKGPIYARVNSDGYLAMYQTSTKPVDVQKFDSFISVQRPFTSFLTVRLEPDGNLRGYYWDGSKWLLNYKAITEICDLPSPCGSYSLCTAGGSGCSCLDNRTQFQSGGCFTGGDGDLCQEGIGGSNYWVLRRVGVEPPHKELLEYKTTSSMEECEGLCERNCSCWGALYNNESGFCYIVDYPIQTMLGTDHESKVGYFKVRKGAGKRYRFRVGLGVGFGVVGGVIGIIGVAICVRLRLRMRRESGERVDRVVKEENGVSPFPYKNIRSESFDSIEMQ